MPIYPSPFPRRRRFVAVCSLAAGLAGTALGLPPLTVETVETAGIDGRHWDKPFPNARTADAVHRSVLLRFPGAAEAIAERLAQGGVLAKAEIVFAYENFEPQPGGYEVRGQLAAALRNAPPRWHYVAWPLRRPWAVAEGVPPPTFNAWLDGAGYWATYGAQDEQSDRHPTRLGPVELSQENPEGRLDVTALLTDPVYGATVGERLRAFAEQGLLIRKWETYDVRYADWSAYEWAVPSGGNGLTFAQAALHVQFAAGQGEAANLPPARDLSALAASLVREEAGGRPTAVMPDAETVKQYSEALAFRQPEWMPDWQWRRVQELRAIGGGSAYADAIESGDAGQFASQMRRILAIPPRFWQGWGVQDQLLLWHQYGEALPDYVRDHLKDYWRAWLYPDLPNAAIDIDPLGDKKFAWYTETRDWRGLFSFFRVRWTQGMGTMNFNHIAAMGALLGGEMIGSRHAIADGRSALEKMPLRFWSFLDGSSQEMLDDYYLSITVSAQKMFADYAPAALDRLMGEMILDRSVELLVSHYHPHSRRIVGSGGRVRVSNVLGYEQDGIYGVLHTLSPAGVLFHADQPLDAKLHGMHLFGYDFPQGRVALQTRAKPWAPEWVKHMLDSKPLPYTVTAANTVRGHFVDPPLWQRAYLGRHVALASADIGGGTAPIVAQWHGGEEPATAADQLGTLTVRYNINAPQLAKTGGGYLPGKGDLAIFQHGSRAIVAGKPLHDREALLTFAGEEGVKTLYTTAALWKFAENPGWEVYVDGAPVALAELPISLAAGQVLTLRDGHAYLGLVPLPGVDLGRDAEVLIETGVPESLGDRHPNVDVAPVLMVNAYNLRQTQPLAAEGPHWERITQQTYGGFVVEVGDVHSHGDFAAFQRHMREAVLETNWDAEAGILHIDYQSAGDRLEMGFGVAALRPDPPHYPQAPGTQSQAIPYRRFNGEDPFPPAGIDRDTTLTQQGTTGRLEKRGAVLELEPGRKGYLITEPHSGTYAGYNPLPDLTDWALSVPGDVEVRADGKLGLARVIVRPATRELWIDQAYKAEQQQTPGIARRLLVFGLDAAPVVTLNGSLLPDAPETVEIEGKPAYAINLE